jgi:hypothetical protein
MVAYRRAPGVQTTLIAVLVLALVGMVFVLRVYWAEPPAYEGRAPDAIQASDGTLPSALFVGDGFVAGVGARGGRTGYPCLTAKQMNWLCNLDAQAGTGYIANGVRNSLDYRPFVDRLAGDRQRYLADVVVVDGGREDSEAPIDAVAAAARNYFQALRAIWPNAVIVVLVPWQMGVTPQDYSFGVAFGQMLREIVRPYDGIVIDPLAEQWVPPERAPSLLYSDGIHPSEVGHAYIATRLAVDLKNAGLDNLRASDQPPS